MIARLGRRLRRMERDQSGATLVELLVAMLVGGIVLALVGSFFAQTARVTTVNNTTRMATGGSSNIMNALSANLRVTAESTIAAGNTKVFESAQPQYAQFYAWASTDPINPVMSKVTIDVTSASLIRISIAKGTKTNGIWSYPSSGASVTTRTFPSPVVAPTASLNQLPLFTYYRGDGSTVNAAATDLEKIRSVTVGVKTKTAGTTDASAVYIENTIVLANLG